MKLPSAASRSHLADAGGALRLERSPAPLECVPVSEGQMGQPSLSCTAQPRGSGERRCGAGASPPPQVTLGQAEFPAGVLAAFMFFKHFTRSELPSPTSW